MIDAPIPANANLAEVLSARALRTPADRLILDVGGGLLVAGATVWAQPPGWIALLAAATCFASYGGWAFAERHLQPVPWPERIAHESLWRIVHGATAVLGIAAFGVLLFATLGIALGPIIS